MPHQRSLVPSTNLTAELGRRKSDVHLLGRVVTGLLVGAVLTLSGCSSSATPFDVGASSSAQTDPNHPQMPRVGDVCLFVQKKGYEDTPCWNNPTIAYTTAFSIRTTVAGTVYQIRNLDGLHTGYQELEANKDVPLTLRPGDTLYQQTDSGLGYAHTLTVIAVG